MPTHDETAAHQQAYQNACMQQNQLAVNNLQANYGLNNQWWHQRLSALAGAAGPTRYCLHCDTTVAEGERCRCASRSRPADRPAPGTTETAVAVEKSRSLAAPAGA